MKLRILGCSGGIAPNKDTTCFLLDKHTLIDAGTGLSKLTLDEMKAIKQIFITHSHLDHLSHLPFLLNNLIGDPMALPIKVYGLPETIQALKKHIFNQIIWPDFTQLPSLETPCVTLHTFQPDECIFLEESQTNIIPIKVNHPVPTVGFWVGDNQQGYFAFSGDSNQNTNFWTKLNQLPPVKTLIIDNQYLESEKETSLKAKHYYAKALLEDLTLLNTTPNLLITHLPPIKAEQVMAQCRLVLNQYTVAPLQTNKIYDF